MGVTRTTQDHRNCAQKTVAFPPNRVANYFTSPTTFDITEEARFFFQASKLAMQSRHGSTQAQ